VTAIFPIGSPYIFAQNFEKIIIVPIMIFHQKWPKLTISFTKNDRKFSTKIVIFREIEQFSMQIVLAPS
jgi:hypothetical protein